MATERYFPCSECGAQLAFAPGTRALRCAHCGCENAIATPAAGIAELDYRAWLDAEEARAPHQEVHVVHCDACGAETTFDPNVTAAPCAWCGVEIVAQAISRRQLTPTGVVPFAIDRRGSLSALRSWLSSRWFAPSSLQRFARDENRLTGVYIPFWTFDCDTTSSYRGERGDDYYDSQTFTAMENGRQVRKQRQVKRTRWRPAAGVVDCHFDDVLVLASDRVPRSLADGLEPWKMDALAPYDDAFLAGFRAESYQTSLQDAFGTARSIMEVAIRRLVRRDIGGDQQRIHHLDTQHRAITFKHILLPIWISTYRYGDKTYRFLVNGSTGEVQGERPYSAAKIGGVVALIVAVVAALLWMNR